MPGLLGYGVYYRRKEKLPFDDEASIIPAVVSSVAAALTIATLGIPTIEVMGIYFLTGLQRRLTILPTSQSGC